MATYIYNANAISETASIVELYPRPPHHCKLVNFRMLTRLWSACSSNFDLNAVPNVAVASHHSKASFAHTHSSTTNDAPPPVSNFA